MPPSSVSEPCDAVEVSIVSAEPIAIGNSRPVPTHTGRSRIQVGTLRDHRQTSASTKTTATSWSAAFTAFPATHPPLSKTDRSVRPTGRSSVQANFRNRRAGTPPPTPRPRPCRADRLRRSAARRTRRPSPALPSPPLRLREAGRHRRRSSNQLELVPERGWPASAAQGAGVRLAFTSLRTIFP